MNQTGRKSALDVYLDPIESTRQGNTIQYIRVFDQLQWINRKTLNHYISLSIGQKLLMTTRNYALHGSHEI